MGGRMGCEYSVYLGPYIQFATDKTPTRLAKYDKFACQNKDCKKFDKALTGDVAYCAACGTKIEFQVKEVEEEYDLLEFAVDMGINDEVCPDTESDEDGDTQLWFPIIEGGRERSFDVKYSTVWEDLTDLDIAAEIEQVRKECAKALKVLEELYGMKADIRWGLLSSITC